MGRGRSSRHQGWEIKTIDSGPEVSLWHNERVVFNELPDLDTALAHIRRTKDSGESVVYYHEDGYIEALEGK